MRENTNAAGDHLNNLLAQVIEGLPRFLGALAILIIGYLIAKAIAAAVHNLLGKAQLNQRLHTGQGGNFIQRAIPDAQGLIATVVYWVIFLFAVSIAVSALGIPVLVDFIRAIYGYLPNVLAAFLIFLVAGALSAAVAGLVANAMGDTPTGKVVSSVVPVLIMVIAVFMILNQLKIAPEIVNATYIILLGSTAFGMALAFGLGGKDVAGKMLQDLYDKGQRTKGQVAGDAKIGANRAKDRADDLRNKM